MADGSSIKLKGVEELQALLKEYPVKVTLTAQRRGLTRGAAKLRTYFRHEAPKVTGTLRKSISYKTVKGSKGSKIRVGLLSRQYYKVLEQGRKPYKRNGRPVAGSPPMGGLDFDRVWNARREDIAQMIIDEAKKALLQEANKIHAKMLGISRRKF
jgi:hypothetical protein